jgi:hypothetical protein
MASNAEDAAAQTDAPPEEPRYADFTRFEIELEVKLSRTIPQLYVHLQ